MAEQKEKPTNLMGGSTQRKRRSLLMRHNQKIKFLDIGNKSPHLIAPIPLDERVMTLNELENVDAKFAALDLEFFEKAEKNLRVEGRAEAKLWELSEKEWDEFMEGAFPDLQGDKGDRVPEGTVDQNKHTLLQKIKRDFPVWMAGQVADLRERQRKDIELVEQRWEINPQLMKVIKTADHFITEAVISNVLGFYAPAMLRYYHTEYENNQVFEPSKLAKSLLSITESLTPAALLLEDDAKDFASVEDIISDWLTGVSAWAGMINEECHHVEDNDSDIEDPPQWLKQYVHTFRLSAEHFEQAYYLALNSFLEILQTWTTEPDEAPLKLRFIKATSQRLWDFEVDKMGLMLFMEITGLSINGLAQAAKPPMPASNLTRVYNNPQPASKLGVKTWGALIDGVKSKFDWSEWKRIDAYINFLKDEKWRLIARTATLDEAVDAAYAGIKEENDKWNYDPHTLRYIFAKRKYERTGDRGFRVIRNNKNQLELVPSEGRIPSVKEIRPNPATINLNVQADVEAIRHVERKVHAVPMSDTELPLGPKVNVIGFVQAGLWREELQIDSDIEVVAVPEGMDDGVDFALRVRGDSMDLEFPEGSIVLCSNWNEDMERPIGRFVIAKRAKSEDEFEYTVKKLTFDKDYNQYYLEPRSSNGEYPVLPFKPKGDLPCTIVGVVETAFKNYR